MPLGKRVKISLKAGFPRPPRPAPPGFYFIFFLLDLALQGVLLFLHGCFLPLIAPVRVGG